MEDIVKRPIGRPYKGPRHTFTVKLDLQRSAKLKEIPGTLHVTGTDYLGPIIEAHIDAIDLHQLHNQPTEVPLTVEENITTATSRSAVQQKPTQEEELRRAQMLAQKINLLLDAIMDESGQPFEYSTIRDGARKAGYFISRSRWSLLKNGKIQVIPDASLRAIATAFDVDPEYLLQEDAELPVEVKAMLPQVRIKRLSEVRDFAARALGPVDPERLEAITKILDDEIQS